MSRFDRHIAKTKDVEIDGDTFTLCPLPLRCLPDMMEVIRALSKMDTKNLQQLTEEEQSKKIMELLDKNVVGSIIELVKNTMYVSYPDESKETMDKFVATHFLRLFPVVLEINANAAPNTELKK